MSNSGTLYYNHRKDFPTDIAMKQINVHPVEQDIITVSYLEREMNPTQVKEALLAFDNYLDMTINSLELTTKLHPKTRKAIRTGHDYITVFKRTAAEYLNMLKEREGCRTSPILNLWLIPLCERYRHLPKQEWVLTMRQHIDTWKSTIPYYESREWTDQNVINAKNRLMSLSGKKHKAGIIANKIVRDRMLNGSKSINGA